MARRVALLWAFVSSSGCFAASSFRLNETQMKEFSAGYAGDCRPTELKVADYAPSEVGSYCGTWIATCRNQEYMCSRTPDGAGGGILKCTPRQK